MTIKITKFEELSDEAVLLLKAEDIGFFSSFDWYENWINSVLDLKNEDTAFLNYYKQNRLALLLPLKFNRFSLESLTNYYSPIFQILSSENSFSLSLVREFLLELKNEPFAWDVLVLQPMDKGEVSLISGLKKMGLPNIPFYCFANWYLEVNQRSFDEYFSGLSSRVKNTVARKTKIFFQLEGAKVEIIHDAQRLKKGIQAFEAVYASSWKGQETYPEFISGLICMASKKGALRLGIAYINDTAIAAQLWVVADDTAYIYKLAYDEKYKKLSTGTILTATLMRYAIDVDKVKCVDYLSGDDAYKKEWMSHRRERWGIMIFNWRSLTGCLKMINEFTRFYFKKFFINKKY